MIGPADQWSRVRLHHLRYFVATAEELHFRRAAERLHMTQPPLSQAIRELEGIIGTRLLERSRRSVSLTAAGESLLRDARAWLTDLERALTTAQRIGAGHAGRLRLSFVGSALYGVLPELVRSFSEQRPDVELQLEERSTTQQLAGLEAGALDIGFVRLPVESRGLELMTIVQEPLVAALPAGHPLADMDIVPAQRLGDEPFVLFPRSQAPGLHDAITAAVSVAGRLPRIVQEVPEMQTIVGLVASGMGVSLVPEAVRALARRGVVYRRVAGAPRSDLAMATNPGDASPMVRSFIEAAMRHQAPA